jgi:hypothetical protein
MMNLITSQKPLTSAQQANLKYSNKDSKLIDPQNRIDDCLKFDVVRQDELRQAIKSFKTNNPNLTLELMIEWLPEAKMVPLSEIMIDDTMNRPVKWDHLINIITDFKPFLIDGVRVYIDKHYPNKCIAWDGQHTTLALYIIFKMIFGVEDISKIMIPVTLNKSKNKPDIRINFIGHNTSTKKGGVKEELSNLDLFGQKIFGVRIDLSTDPDWVESEKKQQYLEDADLFLAPRDERLKKAGAILQPEKILKETSKNVGLFSEFQKARGLKVSREIDGQETVITMDLMRAFAESNIELDSQDFTSMIDIFYNSFKLDFRGKSKSVLYSNLDHAFDVWYHKVNGLELYDWYDLTPEDKDSFPERESSLTVQSIPQAKHAVTYLVALLKKFGTNSKTPFTKIPKISDKFKPEDEDVK